MLNERVIFDFGPDLPVACQHHDVNLSKLEHIFITHTHSDHLQLSNLWLLQASRKKLEKAVNMYMSYEAFLYCKPIIQQMEIEDRYDVVYDGDKGCMITFANKNRVEIKVVNPYIPFEVDRMNLFAVQSNHTTNAKNEQAFNYLVINENGTKLLYACDTGMYSKANLESLENAGLHVLIMEATFGSRPLSEDSTHLNGENFIRMVELMSEYGIVNERTQIFSTHLSQAHDFDHDDLQSYFDKNCRYKVCVAYDGLVID